MIYDTRFVLFRIFGMTQLCYTFQLVNTLAPSSNVLCVFQMTNTVLTKKVFLLWICYGVRRFIFNTKVLNKVFEAVDVDNFIQSYVVKSALVEARIKRFRLLF